MAIPNRIDEIPSFVDSSKESRNSLVTTSTTVGEPSDFAEVWLLENSQGSLVAHLQLSVTNTTPRRRTAQEFQQVESDSRKVTFLRFFVDWNERG